MKICTWHKSTANINIYHPSCKKYNFSDFFNNKTLKEIGYKYCPYCGGKIEESE